MSAGSMGGRVRDVPGNKVGAAIIWITGAYMTREFLGQITPLESGALLLWAFVIQVVLTLGQSPVWRGRGDAISYTCLIADAVINFGGVMFFMANIDDSGSVQALSGAFFGSSGEWPLFVKGLLALFFAAIIAGLPEYLWKLD